MVSAPIPASRGGVRRGSVGSQKGYGGYRSSEAGGNGVASTVGNTPGREKQVGQFVLGKTMGEGTFGEVKLAMHKPTSEKVAAKVLEKSRIKTIADVKRVSREIKILKRVRHPNVIALYEVLDTPSTIYFMTEHCDGGELFDYIVRHQRLQEGQACFFFRQLVDGIEYLHEHDVTHRDLKPENLLLQSSADGWRLKIIDFGLSNTHEGGKLLQTACGSPCYAAPEMIAGKSYRGPAADMWSCGVVLFALVAGFLPFEDPNTSALYKKILSGSYEKPQWLSGGAIHLLSRILDTDPETRAAVPEIRAHAWYVGAHTPAALQAALPHPGVPAHRSDLNDKVLSYAVRLVNGGRGRVAGRDAFAEEIEAAAEGLLSGRHDSIGTAYHLLLKRELREKHSPRSTASEVGRMEIAGGAEAKAGQAGSGVPTAVTAGIAKMVVIAGGTGGRAATPALAPASVRHVSDASRGAHRNASCASSTSSSRSAPSTARRRDSGVEVAAQGEDKTRRSIATTPSGGAGAGNSGEAAALSTYRPPIGPRENQARAQSASGTGSNRSSTAARVSEIGGVAEDKPMPGGTSSFTSGFGRQGGGTGNGNVASTNARSAGQSHSQHHPVPLLSLRALPHSGPTENFGSAGRGITATVSATATTTSLVSQTARDSAKVGSATAATIASINHRRASHVRRQSGGSNISTSSKGGTGGGGDYWKAGEQAATVPRRPLTARAPLRSSSPTPRLSADFSLSRPRGAPMSIGGGSCRSTEENAVPASQAPTAPTPRATHPSTAGAPLSAERVVVAAERRPASVIGARKSTITESATMSVEAPASSVAASHRRGSSQSHHHHPQQQQQQQQSLRVRLSTLSAKTSQPPHQQQQHQRWRDIERPGGRTSTTQMTAVFPAAGSELSAQLPPRRPSSFSTPYPAATGKALATKAGSKGNATLPPESPVAKTQGLGSTAIATGAGGCGRRPSRGSSSSSTNKAAVVAAYPGGSGGHAPSGTRPPHDAFAKGWGRLSSAGSSSPNESGMRPGVTASILSPATAVRGAGGSCKFSAGDG